MAVHLIEKSKTDADQSGSNGTYTPVNGHESVPLLQAGDYLTRAEFERRYTAQPDTKKAELIEGIVYMPSPVRANVHGDPHFVMVTWAGVYIASTPGIRGSDNATLRMDLINEPQPDALLRLDSKLGGGSSIDDDGYLRGAPEFIVEVAASTSSYDMNQKKEVYARHGIQEYLVVLPNEERVVWFTLRDGGYEALESNAHGVLQSEIFPGLWLQPEAIWTHDLATILSTLRDGLNSPEHATYLKTLEAIGHRSK